MNDELLFVPLGGAGEIGMNTYLYGIGPADDPDWLMVDCGITFSDGISSGVDVIVPDLRFIAERRDKLKGLVITHAHEDHLGAIPYLWDRLQCPVYAPPFAAAFLRKKLSGDAPDAGVPVHEFPIGGRMKLGPFDLESVPVTHSIPEATALAIRTKLGTVLHTGDFKFDSKPVVGGLTDETALMRIGDEGVLAMVCDSTNVFAEGTVASEGSLLESMTQVIGGFRNRVVVSCFASNVARLLTISRAAEANGRSVVLVGRSLWRIVETARSCGYLRDTPEFLDDRNAKHLPKENTLIISTGCQGEPRAALPRIVSEAHPRIRLDKGDAVLFSSRIIPGNEIAIARLHNELIRRGIEVVTERDRPIHVSGHPARGEMMHMYDMVRPQIAIPMHGETIHLKEHRRLARDIIGIPRVVMAENGSMVRLAGGDGGAADIIDSVPVGAFAVDGNRLVALHGEMMRSRRRALWNGTVVVTLVTDKRGRPISPPKITTSGLVENDELDIEDEAAEAAAAALGSLAAKVLTDNDALTEAVRITVRRFFRKALNKNPITTVHLVRV